MMKVRKFSPRSNNTVIIINISKLLNIYSSWSVRYAYAYNIMAIWLFGFQIITIFTINTTVQVCSIVFWSDYYERIDQHDADDSLWRSAMIHFESPVMRALRVAILLTILLFTIEISSVNINIGIISLFLQHSLSTWSDHFNERYTSIKYWY